MDKKLQKQVKLIDELLKMRARDFPRKGPHWKPLHDEMAVFSQLVLNQQKSSLSTSMLAKIDALAPYPVFICGAMKSGTTLLTQLLDNHKELLVLPGDSHYMAHQKKNFDWLYAYWIKRLINPSGQPPFWFLGKNPSLYTAFGNYLQQLLKKGYPEFFSVVGAIYAANPKLKSRKLKYWVEKTPSNESYAKKLLSRHPQAKFIHIVRMPLANAASLKKLHGYKKRSQDPFVLASAMAESYRLALRNRRRFGEKRYLILRYEDVVENPKVTMQTITKFLGISFSASLLSPTKNGVLAMSNSMYADRRKAGKVIAKGKDRWKSELTKAEQLIISSFTHPFAQSFGYNPRAAKYNRCLIALGCVITRLYSLGKLLLKKNL